MGYSSTSEISRISVKTIAKCATSVLLAIALIATMTILPSKTAEAAATTIQVPVTYKQTEARSMLSMINSFRASNAKCWNSGDTAEVTYSGLSALTYDYNLERTAMQRAAELAIRWSHTRPNGEDCFAAFSQTAYAKGENIAMGYRTAESVFIGWREDNYKYSGQGHRRNMLSSYFTSVGIGCAEVNGVRFWVQDFANPNSGAAVTPADNSMKNVGVALDSSNISSNSLTLSSTAATLKKGASLALPQANNALQFTASSGLTNRTFNAVNATWNSSNSAVASISNGNVVAKKAGNATLTASFNGATATFAVTVTLPSPSKPTISSVKSLAKKKVTVKWKKASSKQKANIAGYEILCSTAKNFKKGKVKKTAKKSATSLIVKGLKSGNTYYVKMRAYNKSGKTVAYSTWSKTKTVKVK